MTKFHRVMATNSGHPILNTMDRGEAERVASELNKKISPRNYWFHAAEAIVNGSMPAYDRRAQFGLKVGQ